VPETAYLIWGFAENAKSAVTLSCAEALSCFSLWLEYAGYMLVRAE
jgi:hypothetical protein